MEPQLTPEDRKTARVLGISEEKFAETRKAEGEQAQARAATRMKGSAPTPKPLADMNGPCPLCSHSSNHLCTTDLCACTGMVAPSGPADRLTAAEIAICGRLGVSQAEFLKARREEARP